jgi:hypothetical protein
MRISRPSQTPKEPHYITFLKVEEGLGIIITNILNHLSEELYLAGGQKTCLHIGTDKVAERATEILVTGIAQE